MRKQPLLYGALAAAAALASSGTALATDIPFGNLHVDMDYAAGALSLDFRTFAGMPPGVPSNDDDYSPAGNPVIVPLASAYAVPTGAQWACLGPTGSTMFRLPQSQIVGRPWLGWDTVDIPAGVFVNNKVDFELVAVVSAPAGARFVFYTISAFGVPTYQLNTTAGACNDVSMSLSRGAWLYGNWAFSAPGVYTLRFRAKATLLGTGVVVTSPNVDYQFKVQ